MAGRRDAGTAPLRLERSTSSAPLGGHLFCEWIPRFKYDPYFCLREPAFSTVPRRSKALSPSVKSSNHDRGVPLGFRLFVSGQVKSRTVLDLKRAPRSESAPPITSAARLAHRLPGPPCWKPISNPSGRASNLAELAFRGPHRHAARGRKTRSTASPQLVTSQGVRFRGDIFKKLSIDPARVRGYIRSIAFDGAPTREKETSSPGTSWLSSRRRCLAVVSRQPDGVWFFG